MNKPRIVNIRNIRSETPTVKTISFRDELCSKAKPGQFVMVWIPGIEEVPMSLTLMDKKSRIAAITIRKVGKATEILHKLQRNAVIGVRGPYGNSFSSNAKKAVVIGGGTGVAPLLPLVEVLKKKKADLTIIDGAKTRKELLFLTDFKKTVKGLGKIIATTEDGTYGTKGLASEVLSSLLNKQKFQRIYTCGPELMIKAVIEKSRKYGVPVQASLERYMKCGIGLCGSCMIDKYRVCKDGPVFSDKILKTISEFGVLKRDSSGKIIPI
ncbi:MAG: dihydroorotate dehydrogenase electron transfer subunit [Candidatus Bathyarchaeota archaeon]